MVDDVTEHLAGPGRDRVPAVTGRAARGAHRPGRVTQRAAVRAPLYAQLAGPGAGPEEGCVWCDLRAHDGPGPGPGPGQRRRWVWVRGAEFQDAEVHGGDGFVGGEPGAAGGDEPAFAQGGALGAGDVEEAGADGQVLAELEVAVVGLVAVGGDDRGVAGLVQDAGHLAERVVVASDAVQAGHGPDLDHRGGRRIGVGA